MTPSDPLSGRLQPLHGTSGADAQRPADGPQDPQAGAAFKALLDRLEEETRRLAAASDEVSSARDLAGAVDRARESVEEAVQLGDELLEAYRAARQQSETGQEEEGA